MATRTKQAPTVDDVFGDDDPGTSVIPGTGGPMVETSDEPEETPAERIARFVRELSADVGAIVKLYRVGPTGTLEFCDDITPEDYEAGGHLMIRKTWGPGTYQIRVIGNRMGSNGKPQRNILARDNFRIAAVPESAPRHGGDSEMAQTMRAFMEQAQRQNEALMNALAQKPDPHAQMMQTFSLMTAMREAMGVNANQGAPKSSIAEIVEAVRELRGVADEISPRDKDDDDSPMAMLSKLLPLVQAGMQQQAAQLQLPAPAPVAQIQPVRIPKSLGESPAISTQQTRPAPQPQPEPAMNIPPEFAELVATLDQLLELAAAGKNPSEGAEIIYEKIPDEMIELLASRFWFAQLAMIIPRVTPHREWLTEARDQFLAMLDEPEDNEPHSIIPGSESDPIAPSGS